MIGTTLFKSGLNAAVLSVALAVNLLPRSSDAQNNQGLGDMIFTAGTVTTDENGRDWAYLSWMATDLSMLLGVQYDIYAKSGDFDDAVPYQFKGTAQLHTDPQSITVLSGQAVNLGQDLNQLEDVIDQLFAEAVPAGNLTLGEKVAAVIDGSVEDTLMFQNIVFMSQAHPALTLALGRGFACRLDTAGITSFEIRDHNTDEVIGRISVEAGNPLVLPAPGAMTQVYDTSPKGHLNIRLRWQVPDALRRLSLMQFGYNLYRMDYDFAVNNGYDGTPPGTALLQELAQVNPQVKRVNNLPILPDEDAVEPNTYFFIDDNDGLSGGIPFVDGEQYVYFVTALDLLGRDGEVSAGFTAEACDRVAPRVPKDIRTRALYTFDEASNTVQSVEISWDQDPDAAETHAYYVYRYDSIAAMQANAANELFGRIAGPIARQENVDRLMYTNVLTAADQDRTYWYTVRAIDDAACGPNLSLNSAPVHGGIHDWEGPEDQGEASVGIYVETLNCWADQFGSGPDVPDYDLELNCIRTNAGAEWVEFAYMPGESIGQPQYTPAIFTGRHYFGDSPEVKVQVKLPEGHLSYYTIYCRVGNGMKTSDYVTAVGSVKGTGIANFVCGASYGYTDDSSEGPHITNTGLPYFPVLEVEVPSDAGEYRFYRRVNSGPRTLIGQGETTNALVITESDEQAYIANGGTICYYYQFFDFNGNPGPMTLIDCVEMARAMALPVPVLNPIKSSGTENASPGLEAGWFCAPQGVERFEVAIHKASGSAPPETFSPDLRDIENNGITNFVDIVLNGSVTNLDCVTYMTGRVGANFGLPDQPEFLITAEIELGTEYILMVRATGPNGERGAWSEAQSFIWSPTLTPGPEVPWPARPLPPVEDAPFHPDVHAQLLVPDGYDLLPDPVYQGINEPRIGIQIGSIPVSLMLKPPSKSGISIYDPGDPSAYLYTNADGETVFPCALYRIQVDSPQYPNVSGDVVQVSVLMEALAWGQGTNESLIYDPFVAAARTSTNDDWDLYLLDTHPMVYGASYRYLLVRFGPDGEMLKIYNVGTVSIPQKP
ncbi:hypothetical protein [Pontiella agarivorans]|uniref:Fibronectin type-III domain-containing protein n=1 Tax=Pontiella agarivorans TaxID=3038953 RepID=A0ABU5MXT5_9BACT|nr:hypothetical protein [Pontiella agarivorans]MDZ8119014.1 hypothetical protein [Pontiella agarivorans]